VCTLPKPWGLYVVLPPTLEMYDPLANLESAMRSSATYPVLECVESEAWPVHDAAGRAHAVTALGHDQQVQLLHPSSQRGTKSDGTRTIQRDHTELRAAPVQYLWLVCVDRVFWASRTCIIMAATRKGKPSSASNPDPSSWLAFTIAPDQRDTNRESA
jgi:hypothetical protein